MFINYPLFFNYIWVSFLKFRWLLLSSVVILEILLRFVFLSKISLKISHIGVNIGLSQTNVCYFQWPIVMLVCWLSYLPWYVVRKFASFLLKSVVTAKVNTADFNAGRASENCSVEKSKIFGSHKFQWLLCSWLSIFITILLQVDVSQVGSHSVSTAIILLILQE